MIKVGDYVKLRKCNFCESCRNTVRYARITYKVTELYSFERTMSKLRFGGIAEYICPVSLQKVNKNRFTKLLNYFWIVFYDLKQFVVK